MASVLICSIVVNGSGKSRKYYDRPIPEVQRIVAEELRAMYQRSEIPISAGLGVLDLFKAPMHADCSAHHNAKSGA